MAPPSFQPNHAATLEHVGRGPSLRTISLNKNEFDKQAGGGLWRISITARAGPAVAAPSADASPNCAAPLCPGSPGGRLARLSSGPPRRYDAPRSIFGLPIVSCRNRQYMAWSLAVLLVDLTYSAFLLPLSIGFQVNDLAWTWACFVDLAAGLIFATELFLGFSVSFMASNRGEQREVCGGRAVARYYLRYGSFWQDALSTAIWVTQIVLLLVCQVGGAALNEGSSAFQILRIVRMIRFFSVMRQLFVLTIGSGSGSLIPGLHCGPRLAHTLNISYASAVLLHFVACLWNFIVIREGFSGTFMNPIAALVRRYAADGASLLTAEELAGVPAAERYVVAVYWSLVTMVSLGYGDIVPTNPLEYLVDMAVVAFGVLMFGLALGSMAELVASSSKEARQAQVYRDKMEAVNSWLHGSNIPRPLKLKIRAYYSDVWLRHAGTQQRVADQFQELPHALRQEVAWEQNRRLLCRLPLFRELDDGQRRALAGMMLPVDLTPGQELCVHGEPANCFWMLHEGEVQLFDESDTVACISAPAVLGVEALLQHIDAACAARPYGYRTTTPCTVWEARLEDLMPYLLEHGGVLRALCSRAREQRATQHETQGWLGVDLDAAAAGAAANASGGGSLAAPSGTAASLPLAGAASELQQEGHSHEVGTSGGTDWQRLQHGPDAHPVPANMSVGDCPAALERQPSSPACDVSQAAARPTATQQAAEMPAQGLAGAIQSAGDTECGAPASKGDLLQLSLDVAHRLDALVAELKCSVAAACLAQHVTAQAQNSGSGGRQHGQAHPGSTGHQQAPARRGQWMYGFAG